MTYTKGYVYAPYVPLVITPYRIPRKRFDRASRMIKNTKVYVLSTGTKISRYNWRQRSWGHFVTTKEAIYTENDLGTLHQNLEGCPHYYLVTIDTDKYDELLIFKDDLAPTPWLIKTR